MARKEPLKSDQQQLVKLKDFVKNKMTMTANYQPVILRELLTNGGTATQNELCLALLQGDQDVMDYWRRTLMRWPLDTLRNKHQLIEYQASNKTFKLLFDLSSIEEVTEIVEVCEDKISKFNKQAIPKKASTRFKLIEQAKGCCQACGALGNKTTPLDIDHIIPQSKAKNGKIKTSNGEFINVNDESNLQVLCSSCNRGKKDQGHFNFKPSEKRLTEAVSEILQKAIELGFNTNEIIKNAQKFATSA
jgi:5-methylcytosine-specific restriction endonuclease McrA